jgi:hypothetical protein
MSGQTKQINSQSCIDKDHQEHQSDKVGDRRNDVHKGIKNDLDVLLRSD